MRRTIVLLATMALTLLVASGVALAVTKIGTNGPDTLQGTNKADNLLGNGGNDVLYALGGRDTLVGGGGKDWVLGGNKARPLGGVKTLLGGPGNDGMFGGRGPDDMVGGSGNDRLSGDPRPDRMRGEEGRDIVDGDSGSDRLFGGAGPDWLNMGDFGEVAQNTLSGGDGDDALIANNRPARRDKRSGGRGFQRGGADTKDPGSFDRQGVRKGPTSEQEIDALFVELGFRKVDAGLPPDPTAGG